MSLRLGGTVTERAPCPPCAGAGRSVPVTRRRTPSGCGTRPDPLGRCCGCCVPEPRGHLERLEALRDAGLVPDEEWFRAHGDDPLPPVQAATGPSAGAQR